MSGPQRLYRALSGYELFQAVRQAAREFAQESLDDGAAGMVLTRHTAAWRDAGSRLDALLDEVRQRLDGASWGRPGGVVHRVVELPEGSTDYRQDELGIDPGELVPPPTGYTR